MNVREKITAAAGSMALNVALVLLLAQAAGAATPSAKQPAAEPQGSLVVVQVADQGSAPARCEARLRTRALVAVILAMIV